MSRRNDIALMSRYIIDRFCSFMRNVIFKRFFLLSTAVYIGFNYIIFWISRVKVTTLFASCLSRYWVRYAGHLLPGVHLLPGHRGLHHLLSLLLADLGPALGQLWTSVEHGGVLGAVRQRELNLQPHPALQTQTTQWRIFLVSTRNICFSFF